MQMSSGTDLFIPVCETGEHPAMTIDAYHRGRPGDNDIQLLKFAFRFEHPDGTVLTSDELESLVESINIYVGNEQNGYLLTAVTELALIDGVTRVYFRPFLFL